MKLNRNILALMTLMAVATASAAGTVSGTNIENKATAEYTDPSTITTANPSGTSATSTSNTVATVVLPKPGFDIHFTSGTADAGTQNVLSSTTETATNQVPGGKVTTPYSVVNTGNIALDVNIAADTTGAITTNGTQTVQYFYATDTTYTTPITGPITLPVDDPNSTADEGIVNIIQVITIPTTADPADIYGASPEGTVTGTGIPTVTTGTPPGLTAGNGYDTGTTHYEDNKAVDTDRQFVRITLYAPNIDNGGNPPGNPSNPVDPNGNPITTPINPPITVYIPDLPGGQFDPTPGTPPTNPATGYKDPANVPIIAGVGANNQSAYPVADTNNDADVVTFTNTLKNNGTDQDQVQLFPVGAVNADGSLVAGATFDPATATFTYTDPNGNAVTVQFVDPVTGAPIPVAPPAAPGTGLSATYPTLTVPAGATAYYKTKVTYPDPDDSATTPTVIINIGADSVKDSSVVSNSTAVNTIYPAAAQFGDTTPALGAVSTPTPVQLVTPNNTFAGTGSPDATDSTAVFPMDLANTGTYPDDFRLTGTVSMMNSTGNPITVPVKYYASDGTLLPKDPNNAGAYLTPVVAAGSEIKVYAVIDVPAGTAIGDYTVNQTATGRYSTIPMSDANDIIRITPFGKVVVAKFTEKTGTAADSQYAVGNPAVVSGTVPADTTPGILNPANYDGLNPTGYKPGDTYSYQIIVKNTYNSPATNVVLSDTLSPNLTYNSATCSNGNTPTVSGQTISCPSTTLTAAGTAGATETLTISVTVK